MAGPPVLSFLLLPDKARRRERATKIVTALLSAFPGRVGGDDNGVLGYELRDLIDGLRRRA